MNPGKVLLTTVLLFALPAWAGASECNSLSAARWMLGNWVAGDGKSIAHESWTERGSRTFEGVGSERALADGKLISSEELRLVEMAGGVYYVAKVEGNRLPVAFALTECSGDSLVFENPEHDFPRRLEYRHGADGGMTVAISDGKSPGYALSFERGESAADAGPAVLAAEDARFAAMAAANAQQLESGLAEDVQYVHSTGQLANRQQLIDSIVGGEIDYLKVTPVERQVILLGDQSALVRGQALFQVVVKGSKLELDQRYLAVYGMSGDGRWRLRSWQSLRLPQKTG